MTEPTDNNELGELREFLGGPGHDEIWRADELWISCDFAPSIPQEQVWDQIIAAFQNPDLIVEPLNLDDPESTHITDSDESIYWAALIEAVASCNLKGERIDQTRVLSQSKIIELHETAHQDEGSPTAFLQDFTTSTLRLRGNLSKNNPAIRTPDHLFEWAIDVFAPEEPDSKDVNHVETDEEPPRAKQKELLGPVSLHYSQLDERWKNALNMRIGFTLGYMLRALVVTSEGHKATPAELGIKVRDITDRVVADVDNQLQEGIRQYKLKLMSGQALDPILGPFSE